MRVMQRELIDNLERRGFDACSPTNQSGVRVRCSQCEALVINGVACHEHGCPNQTYPCVECGCDGATRRRGLCEDCTEEGIRQIEHANEEGRRY